MARFTRRFCTLLSSTLCAGLATPLFAGPPPNTDTIAIAIADLDADVFVRA
jgi:hypothetical protein